MKQPLPQLEEFYVFKFGAMWAYFKGQHFSFWMICCYLFFEFVRPQALFPQIAIIPWAMLFLLGSLVGAFMDKGIKWVSNSANVWITIFFVLILLSMFIAQYPQVSREHFMDFFGWFVIYFLIINIVNTRARFYIFIMIYIAAAAKIAVGTAKIWVTRGFSFTSWGLMGPQGFFQNSGELSILMLMLFPLMLYVYFCLRFTATTKKYERIIMLIFTIAPILTILGASSRGAQIALVVQLLVIFRRSVFRIKSLIGIILFGVLLIHLLPQEQKDRFSNSGDDRTSQQRLLYWTRGWEMIKQYPLTGVGYFNFSYYFESHYPEDMLYEHAQLPHNIFIQVGTDLGFPGVICLFFIIAFCIFETYRISNRNRDGPDSVLAHIGIGLGFGVFGFLVAGQFVTVTYYPFLWVHLGFIGALKNILTPTRPVE